MQSSAAPEIVTGKSLSRTEIETYGSEGYLLIEQLIGRPDIIELRNEIMRIMQGAGMEKSKLRQTTQYLAGGMVDRLVNSKRLQSLAEQLMHGRSTIYMPFTAVKSGGGGGEFHIHQDNQYTTFDGSGINFWIACDEMTPENGCLQIVPRSHLQGTLPARQSPDLDHHKTVEFMPENLTPLRMLPGDCVAFSRLTLHGSGKNQTSVDRVAYSVQYHRNDVSYTDKDGTKKLLLDFPKWPNKPVSEIKPL